MLSCEMDPGILGHPQTLRNVENPRYPGIRQEDAREFPEILKILDSEHPNTLNP